MTTPERTIDINHMAWDYWRWHASQETDWTRGYLASRGLRGVQAGLAPDGWARLVPTLRRKGVTDQELLDTGLALQSSRGSLGDAFRDRLVLPIRDHDNRIIGFTARRNPAADRAGDPPPKYLNTTTTAAFDKSKVVYGLDQTAIRHLAAGADPVVVEGALDVEAVKRLGTDYVPLAACGTAITEGHLQAIRDIVPNSLERLVTALDPDEAGTKGTVRVWDMLTAAEAGNARTAALPPGADPAEMIRTRQTSALRQALDLAPPMTNFVVDHVVAPHLDRGGVEGRVLASREAAERIIRLDHQPLAAAGMHLADRLGGERHDYELAVSSVVEAVRNHPLTNPTSQNDTKQRAVGATTTATAREAASMRAANRFTAAATLGVPASGEAPGTSPPAQFARSQVTGLEP